MTGYVHGLEVGYERAELRMTVGFILFVFIFCLSNQKEGSWDMGDGKGKENLEQLVVPKLRHFMHVIKKIFQHYIKKGHLNTPLPQREWDIISEERTALSTG